jgi:hypothetical protein
MAKTLDVYLHNELTGQLIQDDGGQTVFEYAAVSQVFAGQAVGIKEVHDDIWLVSFYGL